MNYKNSKSYLRYKANSNKRVQQSENQQENLRDVFGDCDSFSMMVDIFDSELQEDCSFVADIVGYKDDCGVSQSTGARASIIFRGADYETVLPSFLMALGLDSVGGDFTTYQFDKEYLSVFEVFSDYITDIRKEYSNEFTVEEIAGVELSDTAIEVQGINLLDDLGVVLNPIDMKDDVVYIINNVKVKAKGNTLAISGRGINRQLVKKARNSKEVVNLLDLVGSKGLISVLSSNDVQKSVSSLGFVGSTLERVVSSVSALKKVRNYTNHSNEDVIDMFVDGLENSDLQLIKKSIDNGFNIFANNNEAIRNAVWYGNLPIIRFLVEKGADINLGLEVAVEEGRQEIVDYLISKGAKVESRRQVRSHRLSKVRSSDKVYYLPYKNGIGKNRDGVKFELGYNDTGANNDSIMDRFYYYMDNGDMNEVYGEFRAFEKALADTTKYSLDEIQVETSDRSGYVFEATVLDDNNDVVIIAEMTYNPVEPEWLHANNSLAKVRKKFKNKDEDFIGLYEEMLESGVNKQVFLKDLLDNGFDINSGADMAGRTLLMTASYYGDLEFVKTLLQNGADINVMTGTDKRKIDIPFTATDFAYHYEQPQVEEYLISKGGMFADDIRFDKNQTKKYVESKKCQVRSYIDNPAYETVTQDDWELSVLTDSEFNPTIESMDELKDIETGDQLYSWLYDIVEQDNVSYTEIKIYVDNGLTGVVKDDEIVIASIGKKDRERSNQRRNRRVSQSFRRVKNNITNNNWTLEVQPVDLDENQMMYDFENDSDVYRKFSEYDDYLDYKVRIVERGLDDLRSKFSNLEISLYDNVVEIKGQGLSELKQLLKVLGSYNTNASGDYLGMNIESVYVSGYGMLTMDNVSSESLEIDLDMVGSRKRTGQSFRRVKNNIDKELIVKLYNGAKRGNLREVKEAIRDGVDFSINDNNAFILSLLNGHLNVAKYLRDLGATITKDDYEFIIDTASENLFQDKVDLIVEFINNSNVFKAQSRKARSHVTYEGEVIDDWVKLYDKGVDKVVKAITEYHKDNKLSPYDMVRFYDTLASKYSLEELKPIKDEIRKYYSIFKAESRVSQSFNNRSRRQVRSFEENNIDSWNVALELLPLQRDSIAELLEYTPSQGEKELMSYSELLNKYGEEIANTSYDTEKNIRISEIRDNLQTILKQVPSVQVKDYIDSEVPQIIFESNTNESLQDLCKSLGCHNGEDKGNSVYFLTSVIDGVAKITLATPDTNMIFEKLLQAYSKKVISSEIQHKGYSVEINFDRADSKKDSSIIAQSIIEHIQAKIPLKNVNSSKENITFEIEDKQSLDIVRNRLKNILSGYVDTDKKIVSNDLHTKDIMGDVLLVADVSSKFVFSRKI